MWKLRNGRVEAHRKSCEQLQKVATESYERLQKLEILWKVAEGYRKVAPSYQQAVLPIRNCPNVLQIETIAESCRKGATRGEQMQPSPLQPMREYHSSPFHLDSSNPVQSPPVRNITSLQCTSLLSIPFRFVQSNLSFSSRTEYHQ